MRLSILIITWNSLDLLKECLSSLDIECYSDDVELILVDNGSQDGTIQYIKQYYPTIKLIELPVNKGVAYARNRGIEISQGKYILLLDNDTVANQEAIEGMFNFMEKYSDVGICGCRLEDKDSRVQESYKCYPGLNVKLSNLLKINSNRYSLKNKKIGDEVYEPDYLIGACQLIRRKLIEEIGLLDEHIFYGPEDADYCLRARAAKWRICYISKYKIVHHWQRVTNRNIFSKLAYKHTCALFYFYWKHKRFFK